MTTEQRIILDNVAMAYVNGHIQHEQAAQALDGLQEHWRELAPPAAAQGRAK